MFDLADVLFLTYIYTRGVYSSSRAHKNSKFNKQRVFVYQTRYQHVYGSALGDQQKREKIIKNGAQKGVKNERIP